MMRNHRVSWHYKRKQVESIEDMEAMMEGDMLKEDVPVKYLN